MEGQITFPNSQTHKWKLESVGQSSPAILPNSFLCVSVTTGEDYGKGQWQLPSGIHLGGLFWPTSTGNNSLCFYFDLLHPDTSGQHSHHSLVYRGLQTPHTHVLLSWEPIFLGPLLYNEYCSPAAVEPLGSREDYHLPWLCGPTLYLYGVGLNWVCSPSCHVLWPLRGCLPATALYRGHAPTSLPATGDCGLVLWLSKLLCYVSPDNAPVPMWASRGGPLSVWDACSYCHVLWRHNAGGSICLCPGGCSSPGAPFSDPHILWHDHCCCVEDQVSSRAQEGFQHLLISPNSGHFLLWNHHLHVPAASQQLLPRSGQVPHSLLYHCHS